MKVFVLGGYGAYGSEAARHLASIALVDEIAIAGRNIDSAREMCAQIGAKAVPVQVDGADEDGLTEALSGYDVIVNVTFNPLVIPALRAAIRAGVHYLDVAHGDVMWEARQLASEARSANITAIVGMGVQPGLTNIMATRCSSQLDSVKQYQLGWPLLWFGHAQMLNPMQWQNDPRESLEFVQKFKGNLGWQLSTLVDRSRGSDDLVSTYSDGQWKQIDPTVDGIDVPADGGGMAHIYPYGSSGLFLPGALPFVASESETVQLSISPFPLSANDLVRDAAKNVLNKESDVPAALDSIFSTLESDPERWLTVPVEHENPPFMWVAAVGTKDGRPARVINIFTPGTWHTDNNFALTSLPLAIATVQVLDGTVEQRGIFWPEAIIDANPMFREVAKSLPVRVPDDRLIEEVFTWLDKLGRSTSEPDGK